MSQSSKVTRQLRTEIDSDFRSWLTEFQHQLRATTPIRSGVARNGWRDTYRGGIGKQKSFPIARNDVPYIDRLDKGWSQQAPKGIVEEAARKTRKK